ncbi:RIO1 family regulatory kinase/ATPase [Thermoproteus tenax]|uniref:RIO1 family regulatory kinase/ATPase domain-containing protein n=1 Tax=Thermoproteus tenax TaxID=2271 RepID=UPI001E6105A6|nr:RIO1 family regulatory kinase/ATPase [Thermoproteus tenax]
MGDHVSIVALIELYNSLDKLDLRVLRVLEVAHSRYQYVPYKLIVKYMDADERKVGLALSKLNKLKLVQRAKSSYEGYRLTFNSYDILAIHTLRKAGKLLSLSPTPIGVGKESVVYAGETPSGLRVAVKLHRTGTSSFVHVRKLRIFLGKRRHLTRLYEARLSAYMEYAALDAIFSEGGSVPEPIAYNRHAVVMRYVDGIEAYRAAEVSDAYIDDVKQTMEIALRNGIIHGDLTPYNILLGDRAYVIDWPQWVPVTHPNANDILNRDLYNIYNYFSKFNKKINIEEILNIFDRVKESMTIKARLSELVHKFIESL